MHNNESDSALILENYGLSEDQDFSMNEINFQNQSGSFDLEGILPKNQNNKKKRISEGSSLRVSV